MNADSFLDRLCDKEAQPVNLHHLRWGEKAALSAEVSTAWASYRNAVDRHTHLRTSLFAFICVHLR